MSTTGLRQAADPAHRPGRLPPGPLVPPRLQRRLGWLALATALWVIAWAAPVWHHSSVPAPFAQLDRHMELTGSSVYGVAGWFANLDRPGRLAVILAVATALCIIGRSWRALLALAASLVVVVVTVEVILKPLVDSRIEATSPPSFPSGHTAVAWCLGTLAVLLLGRRHGPLRLPVPLPLRVLVITLAVAIGPVVGVSMVVIGAHSAIDVLGALPLGVTLTLLTCAAVDQLGRPSPAP